MRTSGSVPCQENKGLTIASEHEELVVVCDIVCDDVRICRYDLLLGRDRVVLLVLKVTKSPSKSQVACAQMKQKRRETERRRASTYATIQKGLIGVLTIDTAELDVSTSGHNPAPFG